MDIDSCQDMNHNGSAEMKDFYSESRGTNMPEEKPPNILRKIYKHECQDPSLNSFQTLW